MSSRIIAKAFGKSFELWKFPIEKNEKSVATPVEQSKKNADV